MHHVAGKLTAAADVVKVASVQISAELNVRGEATVGRQQQEMRLNALEIAFLLHRLRERRKRLVH